MQEENQFSRTQILFGKENIERLAKSHVAIFGIGGVGGYVLEALARSGIGHFDIIDNDTVNITNINRQIIATMQTVGRDKVEVAKERVLSINPDASVNVHKCFFLPENANEFDFSQYDYVVDAVDTVAAKIQIIVQAKAAGVKVISSMGAGNKMNPALLQVADIYKTSVCPLARVMRQELKKHGIKDVKVVFSTEVPMPHVEESEVNSTNGNVATANGNVTPTNAEGSCRAKPASAGYPASTAFVPPAAGLLIASEVVKDLIKGKGSS